MMVMMLPVTFLGKPLSLFNGK